MKFANPMIKKAILDSIDALDIECRETYNKPLAETPYGFRHDLLKARIERKLLVKVNAWDFKAAIGALLNENAIQIMHGMYNAHPVIGYARI